MNSDDGEQKPPAVMVSDGDMALPTASEEQEEAHPPPSSVHGEVGDEEEDNWSRQVETDTTPHRLPSMGDEYASRPPGGDDVTELSEGNGGATAVPQPEKPELSMKEKLVLRERQRRIETERARLKRQFAQSTAEETAEDLDGDEEAVAGGALHYSGAHSVGEGTLGEESTRAHPDEESAANDEDNRLGFNMERFLRNSDSFNPQLEPMNEDETQEKGVVMERFLNDPVVVPDRVVEQDADTQPPESSAENGGVAENLADSSAGPHRSVSFDVEGVTSGPHTADDELLQDNAELVDASILSNADTSSHDEPDIGGLPTSVASVGDPTSSAVSLDVERDAASSRNDVSSTDDEPRVLRLTEADMLEMAAIEVASLGNAPPSDRDEEEILSEIGELAHFRGGHHGLGGDPALSHGTPTTAMESASQISGSHSQRSTHLVASAVSSSSAENRDMSLEQNSVIEGIPPASSDPSHLLLSPGAGSVIAHPPSESGRDDVIGDSGVIMPNTDAEITQDGPDRIVDEQLVPPMLLSEENVARVPEASGEPGALVNRQRRYNPPGGHHNSENGSISPGGHEGSPAVVDGFDFDKNALESPLAGGDDSFRDLPNDVWTPQGKMQVSPMHAGPRRVLPSPQIPALPINYGAVEGESETVLRLRGLSRPGLPADVRQQEGEEAPLLGVRDDIPPEIITRQNVADPEAGVKGQEHDHHHGNHSLAESIDRVIDEVFHEVRSIEEEEKDLIVNESDVYLASSMWARGRCGLARFLCAEGSKAFISRICFSFLAFPERQYALLLTMLLEVPVLLMITGGSDRLCALVGRSRYQLLVGFLPLTSAISGNVGLQASTLTTRAISHSHVTSDEFMTWFWHEVGAAAFLGIGMGLVLGSLAFVASQMDIAFGITIFVAQFISIVTAGVTGTFAPLLFSFVFHRDSGKWGGPLETAIQDIVGSFAMVVISYHILLLIGPGEVDPSDMCVVVDDIGVDD